MAFTYDDSITLPTNKVDGGQPSKPTEWVANDANGVDGAAMDLRTAVKAGQYHGLADMSASMPAVAPGTQARFVSKAGRFVLSEGARRYKRLTKEDAYYDIRDWGAVPGPAGQTATTAAINAIFAEISTTYVPPAPPAGGLSACIYVPAVPDALGGWYVGDLNPYFGNVSVSLVMLGDAPSGYGGNGMSNLIFGGTSGGTMLSFVAINSSTLQNITFNGNGLAKVVVNARQFWDDPNLYQSSSNGLYCHNCKFINPIGDLNSVLFMAGRDDHPGPPQFTLQAADYHFFECEFSGHATVQGYGFADFVGGNTKQWSFDNCIFQYVYQGIHAFSGYLGITNIEGSNIGYNRDSNACLVYAGGTTNNILGGGFENGSTGYMARLLIVPQGSPCSIAGVYFSGTTPPDDYAIINGGPSTIDTCSLEGNRQFSYLLPWTPSTAIALGQVRTHDTDKFYTCTTAGTTGLTGPTGTGTSISDGSVVWTWSATGPSHIAKIQGVANMTSGFNPIKITNCTIPYMDGVATNYVPLYDGSQNLVTGSIVDVGVGTANYAAGGYDAFCFGNTTGDFLGGGPHNVPMLNFFGTAPIMVKEQVYSGSGTANNPGQTIVRNDNEVFVVTVPAAVIAASQGTSFRTTIGTVLTGRMILDAIVHINTGLSGPGVTGIKLSLGTYQNLTTYIADDILLAQAADVSDTFIGLDTTQRGVRWRGPRAPMLPLDGGTYGPGIFNNIMLVVSVTGGAVININAGSVTVYLTTKRWGAF